MRTIATIAASLMVGIAIGAGGVTAWSALSDNHLASQPYADQQGRTISSLSAADVEQLRAGQGWGLAKPAEFNGYPGPAHVLEFTEQLALTENQLRAVEASFQTMQAQAATLGSALVEAEAALDSAFVDRDVTPDSLTTLLTRAEELRADLRETHLTAHLEVTPLLRDEQKTRYQELRGYGDGHSGHSGH
ncbi:MAG: Spy/CpxP family protein refolding chaperone [Pseudomonadota bacterium]